MNKFMAVLAGVALMSGTVQAQWIPFNTIGQTITEDFDGQTSGNLPSEWGLISENGDWGGTWRDDNETGTAGGVRYVDFDDTRYLSFLGNTSLDGNGPDVAAGTTFLNNTGETTTVPTLLEQHQLVMIMGCYVIAVPCLKRL